MKIFRILIGILIISFLGLYISYTSGYYQKLKSEKVIITNQKIEEFENDIKNGKDISLEDYTTEEVNYSNKTSRMSLKFSNKASNLIDNFIKFLFRKLGNVVE